MAKQKTIDTGARLPEDLNVKLQEYADRTGLSKNSVILLALNEYLGQKS